MEQMSVFTIPALGGQCFWFRSDLKAGRHSQSNLTGNADRAPLIWREKAEEQGMG